MANSGSVSLNARSSLMSAASDTDAPSGVGADAATGDAPGAGNFGAPGAASATSAFGGCPSPSDALGARCPARAGARCADQNTKPDSATTNSEPESNARARNVMAQP